MTEHDNSSKTVVIVDGGLHPFHDFSSERDRWASSGIDLVLESCQTEADLLDMTVEADALVYWGLHTPITRRVIEAQTKCRLIARYGTGVDSVDVEAATENGIPVAIPAGYCTDEVALHATTLLLTLARRVVFLDRVIAAGGWREPSPHTDTVDRLSNQTLGLLGFGRIAQQVAKNMQPMVREILCADPFVDESVATDLGVRQVEFEEIIRNSDLISVHLPLTSETRNMLGEQEFNAMKPGSFLVNTSRGPVIDESALAHALASGQLAGAGLDVFTEEPLPSDSPLRDLPNVVFTPHFASNSEEAKADMFEGVARIVEEAMAGQWPDGVVNPAVKPKFTFSG